MSFVVLMKASYWSSYWSVKAVSAVRMRYHGRLLMLWLYLDDSGKWAWNPHSTASLGFGGAIGSVSQWCRLLAGWRQIVSPLDPVGIDAFHATEWRDKNLVFLSRLAPSLCEQVFPTGAVMPAISLALAQGVAIGDVSQKLRAYDFAFEDSLSIAAKRASAVGDSLYVILARNDEYNQRAFDLFREFKKRRPEGVALRGFYWGRDSEGFRATPSGRLYRVDTEPSKR